MIRQGESCGNQRAFTRVECAALITVVGLLVWGTEPLMSGTTEHAHKGIDLNNVRQLSLAMNMYATDNRDYLPHPGWGYIDGGPGAQTDSWAYAAQNKGRNPALPHDAWIPSGMSQESRTNQIPYFKIGQLGPYLRDEHLLECATDIAQRAHGDFRQLYRGRAFKLSSYVASGAISGFSGVHAPNADFGGTYKIHGFRGPDVWLWETAETDPFNFNGGGNNALNPREGLTQRHGAARPAGYTPVDLGGSGVVGCIDGSAEFMRWKEFNDLALSPSPNGPNRVRCGPGFR